MSAKTKPSRALTVKPPAAVQPADEAMRLVRETHAMQRDFGAQLAAIQQRLDDGGTLAPVTSANLIDAGDIINAKEAAFLAGVSTQTMYRHVAEVGRLIAGAPYFFRSKVVTRWPPKT